MVADFSMFYRGNNGKNPYVTDITICLRLSYEWRKTVVS